ncbi:hypothetical protein COO60DRAFT_1635064 [Scenedesmus sp. NREL 46B-D3]|nr:hypothetical protein COO60DRAFT_1635064 [Scenedesmus sp. NREL 46B-D3]
MASSVVVFTTPGCPYCKRAKQALSEQKVSYKEVDVSVNTELRAALKEATGQRTVPQVYAGGTLVGGSDALLAMISDGRFTQLLSQASSSQAALPEQLSSALQAADAVAAAAAPAAAAAGSELPEDLQQVLTALSDSQSGLQKQPGGSSEPPNFTGKALLDWLVQHSSSSGSSGDRAAAARRRSSCSAVADGDAQRYALRSDAVRAVPWGAALNTHFWWGPAAARPAEVVAGELRARILALYDKHLSADGRAVSYAALKQDPEFWDYVDATAELQRVDLTPLSRESLMAFAINLYNALVIHALVVHGPGQYNSSTGRIGFFQKASRYNIGGYDYVLDDLENGILRGNRPAASSIGMLLKLPRLSKGPFKGDDPRAKHVVQPLDPRIHFALVCGAKSCPPIKLYSAATLEEGLAAAAETFCASDVEIEASAKKVHLSKIFSWYFPDFGADKAARLRFLLPHLPEGKRASLEQLLAADPAAKGISVKHKPYDWTINAAE